MRRKRNRCSNGVTCKVALRVERCRSWWVVSALILPHDASAENAKEMDDSEFWIGKIREIRAPSDSNVGHSWFVYTVNDCLRSGLGKSSMVLLAKRCCMHNQVFVSTILLLNPVDRSPSLANRMHAENTSESSRTIMITSTSTHLAVRPFGIYISLVLCLMDRPQG